jgi:hypothetical protein
MLTHLPTIPDSSVIEYQTTILYTALSSSQYTYSVLVVGLPVNYVVCGASIRVVSQFAGSTLTSLTCSLGAFVPNTILTDLTYYCMPYELTQLPTSQTIETSGPPMNNLADHADFYSPPTGLYFNGPHDVAAYFTAIGTTLNNLTAGSVECTVLIRPL